MSTPPEGGKDEGEIPWAEHRSPWAARHVEVGALSVQQFIPKEIHRRKLLFGPARWVAHPLMAIRVSQDMGPARHALAQRVVAGTKEVNWLPLKREDPPTGGSKK